MLIGTQLRWAAGVGESKVDVGLRIGDAQVVLEVDFEHRVAPGHGERKTIELKGAAVG